MRIFIMFVHIVLGLSLIFYSVNNLLYLASVTHNPAAYYPAYSSQPEVRDFVQNIRDNLPQRIAGSIFIMALGLLSIVGAIAFKKDKRWAILTLPLLPLGISLWLVYSVYSVPKTEVAWTGGIMIFVALVSFMLFVAEGLYIVFRKKAAV